MIREYLNRIGIFEDLDLSFQSLCKIQKAHLLTVPFENLDIHLKGKLEVDKGILFDKIVKRKRGGLCYETNYLLYLILVELGFDATLICSKTKEDGSFFDHPVIKVYLNNTYYILDVGFGDNFMIPIKLQDINVHNDPKGRFRITRIDETDYLLEKERQDGYEKQFIIRDKEEGIRAFDNRREWYSSSKDSIFVNNLFCSKEYLDGRVSLKIDKIKFTRGNDFKVEEFKGFDRYITYLYGIFGIYLDDKEIKLIKKTFESQSK